MKQMKKLVLVVAMLAFMVAGAAPAMAEEAQDRGDDPSGTGPIVRDHAMLV
jgi:hypothetical protein